VGSSCTKEVRCHRLKPAKYAAYDDRGLPVQLAPYLCQKSYVGEVDVHLGFMNIKVKAPRIRISLSGKKGKKKRITCFSRKSKNTLGWYLRSIVRPDTYPYMLTLTTQEFSEDAAVYHDQIDHFLINFERQFPDSSIVWRLEFQGRGAPHWHCLVYLGVNERPFLDARDEEWIAHAWYQVVGGDFDVIEYGTKLTRPTDGEYVAKLKNYLLAFHHLKEDQTRDDIYTGRYWGIRNKAGLNIGAMGHGLLSYASLIKLRRLARKMIKAQAKKLGRVKAAQYFGRYLRRSRPGSFKLYLDFWHIDRIFEFCGIQEFKRPRIHAI